MWCWQTPVEPWRAGDEIVSVIRYPWKCFCLRLQEPLFMIRGAPLSRIRLGTESQNSLRIVFSWASIWQLRSNVFTKTKDVFPQVLFDFLEISLVRSLYRGHLPKVWWMKAPGQPLFRSLSAKSLLISWKSFSREQVRMYLQTSPIITALKTVSLLWKSCQVSDTPFWNTARCFS